MIRSRFICKKKKKREREKKKPDFTRKERVLIARGAEGLICCPSAVADVSYFHANVRQFTT